ncbi:MAG TPA: Gfo/Idh/MocA family oxidoreductase [Candidatus Dormibacteraeota bacterium]|nr:Gfo/Idh/MocA family oxidoreductase [Candidatus Dormibacteraeota bacterium]
MAIPLQRPPANGTRPRYRRAISEPGIEPVRVGIVGYGYWGPNLVRNFAESPATKVVAVSDMSEQRLGEALARHPGIAVTTDCEDIFTDPDIDAVAIATPVSTHYPLGLAALQAGKHVLMSKPLADRAAHCQRLINEARARDLVLMVDHTFLYTGAVRKIKQLVDGGNLGSLYYYDSVRVNLGLFQHDVNVLWDLAVHDLAIMEHVLGARPCAVAATGAAHVPGQLANMAYLTCFFSGSLIAHHHVNWLAPVKVRRTLIGGDRQMIVYDDLEPSEKVKVYDKGVTVRSGLESVYESMVGYRTGDMWAPQVSLTEALKVEVQHFADCIRKGLRPISDGESGLRVVRTLEAAVQSLDQRGKPVELSENVEEPAEPLDAVAQTA